MNVAERATREARARHAAGVEVLDRLFRWDRAHMKLVERGRRLATSNVERRRRRAKGKAARAARRRNR